MKIADTMNGTVSLHRYGPNQFAVEIMGHEVKRGGRADVRLFYSQYVPPDQRQAFDGTGRL